jgi:hypothetical protein
MGSSPCIRNRERLSPCGCHPGVGVLVKLDLAPCGRAVASAGPSAARAAAAGTVLPSDASSGGFCPAAPTVPNEIASLDGTNADQETKSAAKPEAEEDLLLTDDQDDELDPTEVLGAGLENKDDT